MATVTQNPTTLLEGPGLVAPPDMIDRAPATAGPVSDQPIGDNQAEAFATPVPEPPTWSVFAFALAVLIGLRLRSGTSRERWWIMANSEVREKR